MLEGYNAGNPEAAKAKTLESWEAIKLGSRRPQSFKHSNLQPFQPFLFCVSLPFFLLCLLALWLPSLLAAELATPTPQELPFLLAIFAMLPEF
jgi:hypothetical protein